MARERTFEAKAWAAFAGVVVTLLLVALALYTHPEDPLIWVGTVVMATFAWVAILRPESFNLTDDQ